MVATLLSTTVGSASTSSPKPFPVEVIPDRLTQFTDLLTVAAIIVGGIFAYFKFIKGRVLKPAIDLEIKALMAPRPGFTSALLVEVTIRNNGQPALKLPKDKEQLVSISSVTTEELTRAGVGLNQDPLSWKQPDAYFASANMLLDDGEQPKADLKLGPGQEATLAAVFPVPIGHHPAAFLVVLNGYAVSRRWYWFRPRVNRPETRKLVVPHQEPS